MSNNYPTAAGVAASDGLFDEPPPPPYPRIELETTIVVEGYTFRVVFRDTSLQEALAMLKKRNCLPASPVACEGASERPGQISDAAEVPPTCKLHNRSMKLMKHPSKTGQRWYCPAKVGDDWCAERA